MPAAERDAVEVVRHLVDSADPTVVFASLARACTPSVADDCTIDLVVYGRRAQQLHSTGALAPAPRRSSSWVVNFAGDAEEDEPYFGVAKFGWRDHEPSPAQCMSVSLLVDRAVAAVALRRASDEAARARSAVAHLRGALETRERIGVAVGILMNVHSCTAAQALERMRSVSLRRDRVLADVAEDVITFGRLELH